MENHEGVLSNGNGELGNEVYFEDFRINERRYTFSIRRKKGSKEHYFVITEKKISGREKKYTHKIRVYAETTKTFLDRLSFIVARVNLLNEDLKKNNGGGTDGIFEVGQTQKEVPHDSPH
jgi:hypothetical protein